MATRDTGAAGTARVACPLARGFLVCTVGTRFCKTLLRMFPNPPGCFPTIKPDGWDYTDQATPLHQPRALQCHFQCHFYAISMPNHCNRSAEEPRVELAVSEVDWAASMLMRLKLPSASTARFRHRCIAEEPPGTFKKKKAGPQGSYYSVKQTQQSFWHSNKSNLCVCFDIVRCSQIQAITKPEGVLAEILLKIQIHASINRI